MAGGNPISGNIGPANIKPTNSMPDEGDLGSSAHGFQSLAQTVSSPASNKPSPMQVAQGAQPSMQSGQVSAQNLVANMQQVLFQMKGLQQGLQTPDLKLNARTRRLLDAKLKRTRDNINFINSKVNVGDEDLDQRQKAKKMAALEATDPSESHQQTVSRFINYLTDGQSQLESAMNGVSNLGNKKDPGIQLESIFSMQVKLYRAQVEIEFSTAVLQKAIDDLKTLMSVQL